MLAGVDIYISVVLLEKRVPGVLLHSTFVKKKKKRLLSKTISRPSMMHAR